MLCLRLPFYNEGNRAGRTELVFGTLFVLSRRAVTLACRGEEIALL